MTSPYIGLPSDAYWRSGVAERSPLEPGNLFTPRFKINTRTRIVTAGSCFAQHVGRTLKKAGFHVQDAEPLPAQIPVEVAREFGYGLYSARYGNVYTTRQLLQLLREALGEITPSNPVWTKDGRYYDAFRPSVEPKGLPTHDDVVSHRKQHLHAVRGLLEKLDVFIFTFGLTETWVAKSDGTVYPTAPETIAGVFDPDLYEFHNLTFSEIYSDFVAVRKIIRQFNRRAKFIVTVSPVPLTATASNKHVEVATTYSKAVLRAVCGQLYDQFPDIDYFPSFEVITSQSARGMYYESNMRSVSEKGVETAMSLFMRAHANTDSSPNIKPRVSQTAQMTTESSAEGQDDLICEEALLEAFARK